MPFQAFGLTEKTCVLCGRKDRLIAQALGVCPTCLREKAEKAEPLLLEAHRRSRLRWGLPPSPPKTLGGIPCNLCFNECRMGPGEKGYCGLRWNREGRLVSLAKPDRGVLHAYRDPHVTNCCAAYFCPGGTGEGYPQYARRPGAEVGYSNLAVFFYGCNFDCFFCQNISHKEPSSNQTVERSDLISQVSSDSTYTCLCFFGGSPEPQLPFALRLSKTLREENPRRVLRVCFEWNGCGNPKLVREAAELAWESGGNLKFDLKAFTPILSLALSGVPNQRAYENFETVAREFLAKRSGLPVVNATTLLVPGYVDEGEVEKIAQFISSLDEGIPYSLLLFHPDHLMMDLPVTPAGQVERCYQAAKKHLRRVHVGNLHLLGLNSMVYGL